MKINFTLLMLLVSMFFLACEKGDLAYSSEFDRSYEVWEDFKASNGDSYRYKVYWSSWTGSSWMTTITVQRGEIVQRDFHYLTMNDIQRPENGWTSAEADAILQAMGSTAERFYEEEGFSFLEVLEWKEMGEELGTTSYIYSSASPTYTLDDIYEKARTDWLKKRSDAEIFFEVENNGMLSVAGYVPNGCMDDCFYGIRIQSIESL